MVGKESEVTVWVGVAVAKGYMSVVRFKSLRGAPPGNRGWQYTKVQIVAQTTVQRFRITIITMHEDIEAGPTVKR